jgi:hypothetical protein
MTRRLFGIGFVVVSLLIAGGARAQRQIILQRDNATVTLESYAPNVVCITMSLDRPAALAPPGLRH